MATRKIVQIDEEKCNGCGECVPSCAEGAIQIVDGKAKLVSDVYCDGLGACLGTCPEDAITIIEREAPEFDEEAALKHVETVKTQQEAPAASEGCPGMAVRKLRPGLPMSGMQRPAGVGGGDLGGGSASALGNWPIQLHLVPPNAPFLTGCDLLLVADCVPFAYADFHQRLLRGRPLVIGCPKLDDGQVYVEKLTDMLRESSIRSVTVVHMEVPCCTGLVRIAEAAIEASECGVPLEEVTISLRGEVLGGDPAEGGAGH